MRASLILASIAVTIGSPAMADGMHYARCSGAGYVLGVNFNKNYDSFVDHIAINDDGQHFGLFDSDKDGYYDFSDSCYVNSKTAGCTKDTTQQQSGTIIKVHSRWEVNRLSGDYFAKTWASFVDNSGSEKSYLLKDYEGPCAAESSQEVGKSTKF